KCAGSSLATALTGSSSAFSCTNRNRPQSSSGSALSRGRSEIPLTDWSRLLRAAPDLSENPKGPTSVGEGLGTKAQVAPYPLAADRLTIPAQLAASLVRLVPTAAAVEQSTSRSVLPGSTGVRPRSGRAPARPRSVPAPAVHPKTEWHRRLSGPEFPPWEHGRHLDR